jgi:hypothetical protein
MECQSKSGQYRAPQTSQIVIPATAGESGGEPEATIQEFWIPAFL